MQTIKQGKEFTGFILLRCSCKNVIRLDVGIYALKGFAADGITPQPLYKLEVECPKCKHKLLASWGKPIYGRFSKETICDSRCTNAVGSSCSCTCGGKNHGKDWSI